MNKIPESLVTRHGYIRVVAAAIVRDDTVLVAQRGQEMLLPGEWEFPGGKVEPAETDSVALAREISEELSATITPTDLVAGHHHEYPLVSIHILLYRARLIHGEPVVCEHSSIAWVSRSELSQLTMASADEPLRHALLNIEDWDA